MTRFFYSAGSFLLASLFVSALAGCQAEPIGQKAGDEMNPAMSAQQKAINAEHKKRAENGLGSAQTQQTTS